ncbi:hypothetical protein J2T08_003629 [Neorhizobium galegae]|uniref:hypothetical protein n=1 Tax=Neorhizobium galegae TaxID=399 RepID=UPI00278AC778|nr:hypothetical protein [Neorhizobium galegae]MDQ0135708.1 hypothetical protein [Neorhizobium galegae]
MPSDPPRDKAGPAVVAAPELRVSYRAVTRYVQRILKITVPGEFNDEKTRARFHCRAAGLSTRAVRKLIWTPGIALAVKMGMPRACNGQFHVEIEPVSGVIVTVTEPWSREHGRLKILSSRELARGAKKIHRKEKRKPKAPVLKVFAAEEGFEHV